MASQKNFAITPSVSISRSKFKRPYQHKTSFNLGQIVPIYLDQDILPGDTVSMDLSTLVRMSTPMAPLMDNIHIDYYAFFVPNRLVWDDWKKFMGENVDGSGAVGTKPIFPTIGINGTVSGYTASTINSGKLGDYLGLPIGLNNANNLASMLTVSALPGRAYALIYNEWFRDQNLIAPLSIYKNSGVAAYGIANGYSNYNSDLLIAAKDSDYFTRALPYAQKGSPVTLPLGTFADVIGSSADGSTVPINTALNAYTQGQISSTQKSPVWFEDSSSHNVKLVADLSNATAATINSLRFAFQYQKFLEKDALYGTRYWEILKGHFGITAPDASLQRPELLGHWRQHINIDQVLQTTGYDNVPSNNELGIPGANSVTAGHTSFFTKSFVEHGILMVLAVARHDQTYGQGVNRSWSRKLREDFYWPVFANLGAQEIRNKEIYAQGTSTDDLPFGYQEAWAEYRYKPSQVSGILNPAVSNSLGFWTLANNFGSLPTLSKSFIEQDRSAISRALVTSSGGPDFIFDGFFDCTYVRPMPMYSIPGLIDHH